MRLVDTEYCCGCGNCEISCKHSAIKIEYDIDGFLKPVINEDKCINCHSCEENCPIKVDMLPMVTDFGRRAYFGCCVDRDTLKESSSGGIASVLSEFVLNENGIVYGSSYSEDFESVYTRRVDTIETIRSLSGSKYIQSVKNDSFLRIKGDLKEGKKVLYVGLPCEIAALKLFLRREYENLITCDLVCHGPTSILIYRDYLKSCVGEGGRIDYVNMRYKKEGKWYPYYFLVRSKDGKRIEEPFWTSDFGFAFSRYCNWACYHCRFKGKFRFSDITLGDAWGADRAVLDSHSGGLSAIMVNSDKGQRILDELSLRLMVTLIDAKSDQIIDGNPNLIYSRKEDKCAKNMADLLRKYGLKRTVKRLRPIKSRIIIAIKNYHKGKTD